MALTIKDALQTLLDQVDYTNKACAPTEMVAAVLPTEVIAICRDAIKQEEYYEKTLAEFLKENPLARTRYTDYLTRLVEWLEKRGERK